MDISLDSIRVGYTYIYRFRAGFSFFILSLSRSLVRCVRLLNSLLIRGGICGCVTPRKSRRVATQSRACHLARLRINGTRNFVRILPGWRESLVHAGLFIRYRHRVFSLSFSNVPRPSPYYNPTSPFLTQPVSHRLFVAVSVVANRADAQWLSFFFHPLINLLVHPATRDTCVTCGKDSRLFFFCFL